MLAAAYRFSRSRSMASNDLIIGIGGLRCATARAIISPVRISQS